MPPRYRITHFCLILTEACNFACRYCTQLKGNAAMTPGTVQGLLQAWEPLWDRSVQVTLYGGEPLLAQEAIHTTARFLAQHRPHRHHLKMTTNGSLLSPSFLQRYAPHPSELRVSHEFWQARDPGRDAPDIDHLSQLLNRLMPGRWAIHSVLEPGQASAMHQALARIDPHQFPDISLSLNTDIPWSWPEQEELRHTLPALKELEQKNRNILGRPAWIRAFAPPQPQGPVIHLMGCNGGRTKIAVDPRGTVWACERFWSISHSRGLHEGGSWGRIGQLDPEHPNPQSLHLPYTEPWDWGQDAMFTPSRFCHTCPNLTRCTLCPAQVLRTGASHPTCVPDWLCRLQQIANTFPTALSH